MDSALQEVIGQSVGASVLDAKPVSGGCINDAFRVALDDGRKLFVKTHEEPPQGMYGAEVHGLDWLRVDDGLRVPRVLSWSDGEPAYLALEDLGAGRPCSDYQARLGRGLAHLHKSQAEGFGLSRQNYLATLTQDNKPADTWAAFLVERRLRPQLRRALDGGDAPRNWARRFDALFSRMDELVGPEEPPAKLHGDLWSGNVHCDSTGQPCLVDPAVYGGHREMDLAMLALFGTVGSSLVDAYQEVYPLAPGRAGREPLYQLYPLLTHVVLFGGSYVAQTDSALRSLE